MAKLIFGAFPDRKQADEAILELEEAGVVTDDFSIIAKERSKTAAVADDAAVGGTAGGLTGLIAGAVTTAGMSVAGPVVLLAGLGWVTLATVTGGVVGAATGGMVGALVGLGIPEEAAKHHESVIRAGGVLLGVEDTEASEQEIRDCFEKHGAEQTAVIKHETVPARVSALVS